MTISLIAAVADDGVIGRADGLPWRLSTDLKRLKTLTMGHHLIMGRKTWDSVGRPLPGRTTIVVTRGATRYPEGVLRAGSLEEAILLAKVDPEPFVLGGGMIFELAMAGADRLYITHVHSRFADGDAWFPAIDDSLWKPVKREEVPADEKNEFDSTFVIYERRPRLEP